MQKKEKRLVPAREEEVVVAVTCDICGAKKPNPTWFSENWGKDRYDINEVVLKRRTGSCYPEGGSGEELQIDICPRCMDEKVLPFLESLGARFSWQSWDS